MLFTVHLFTVANGIVSVQIGFRVNVRLMISCWIVWGRYADNDRLPIHQLATPLLGDRQTGQAPTSSATIGRKMVEVAVLLVTSVNTAVNVLSSRASSHGGTSLKLMKN